MQAISVVLHFPYTTFRTDGRRAVASTGLLVTTMPFPRILDDVRRLVRSAGPTAVAHLISLTIPVMVPVSTSIADGSRTTMTTMPITVLEPHAEHIIIDYRRSVIVAMATTVAVPNILAFGVDECRTVVLTVHPVTFVPLASTTRFDDRGPVIITLSLTMLVPSASAILVYTRRPANVTMCLTTSIPISTTKPVDRGW